MVRVRVVRTADVSGPRWCSRVRTASTMVRQMQQERIELSFCCCACGGAGVVSGVARNGRFQAEPGV